MKDADGQDAQEQPQMVRCSGKRVLLFLAVTVLLLWALLGIKQLSEKSSAYDTAQRELQRAEWGAAWPQFQELGNFRDARGLSAYAHLQFMWEMGHRSDEAERLLKRVPPEIRERYAQEIAALKTEMESYDASHTPEIIAQTRSSLKNRLPYDGLEETYLDDTKLGHSFFVPDETGFALGCVEWRDDAGNRIAFARLLNGKLCHFSMVQPTPTPLPHPSAKAGDPYDYDADEYGTAEDFYDANYDDFTDYEEAEEYWEKNR